MKFTSNKKESIVQYLLEKIKQNTPALSKCVSEAFSISQSVIHDYINELSESGIIKRIQRGKYELVKQEWNYRLSRSIGELNSEYQIYEKYLAGIVRDYPKNISEIWHYAFTEMVNNVIDHSEAEYLYVMIQKDYLTTTVFISDDGVGIFEKIKNHFGFDTLDDAICELFKGKLTTDESRHSGEGIFFTSRVVDNFAIMSDGKIFAHNKYNNDDIIDSRNKKGTAVLMELSNFSKKDIQTVFSEYENGSGDFKKTRIPLKNIFEQSPISRSQAKRLFHRLHNFSQVVLDFEDLEWMGQGFAHELFVVYKNMHPEVEIIPINMSDGVQKMYNHVIMGIK